MSYDLYMKPRSGLFSQDRFLSYFRNRPPYVVEGQQAWYHNEDTGVYFSFELNSGQGQDANPASGYPVLFNMDFFRPSFFALEAEPELRQVVEELDFTVLDPQTDGMGEGEYDSSRFLSGWKVGNQFGYSAMLRDPTNRPDISSLPASKLERIWRWNHARGEVQGKLGEAVFVPRIMFFKEEGAVTPAVVWSDGIPTAFPNDIDSVVIFLKDLAPRTLFRRKEIIASARWEVIRPLVERFGRSHGDAIVGNYVTPPKEVVSFLQSLRPLAHGLVGISADSVLDAELVAQYAGR